MFMRMIGLFARALVVLSAESSECHGLMMTRYIEVDRMKVV